MPVQSKILSEIENIIRERISQFPEKVQTVALEYLDTISEGRKQFESYFSEQFKRHNLNVIDIAQIAVVRLGMLAQYHALEYLTLSKFTDVNFVAVAGVRKHENFEDWLAYSVLALTSPEKVHELIEDKDASIVMVNPENIKIFNITSYQREQNITYLFSILDLKFSDIVSNAMENKPFYSVEWLTIVPVLDKSQINEVQQMVRQMNELLPKTFNDETAKEQYRQLTDQLDSLALLDSTYGWQVFITENPNLTAEQLNKQIEQTIKENQQNISEDKYEFKQIDLIGTPIIGNRLITLATTGIQFKPANDVEPPIIS